MTLPFSVMRPAFGMLMAFVLPIHTASAHPRLLRAVPAPESRLTVAPREITLTFHEAVSVRLCRLTLLDAAKQRITLDSLRAAPGDAKTLTVKILSTVRPGSYTVKWQVGGVDGHPVRGEYRFVVAAGPARPLKGSPPPGQDGAVASATGGGISTGFHRARR